MQIMENNKLDKNFKNFLPINRKERYFTGTVLPQIICFENFRYFNRFTNLIENFPKELSINPDSSSNSIQFMTEYSLNESYRIKEGNKIFENVPTTKETPDLVILITEPEMYLIVGEAKMYSSGNPGDFYSQFQDQKKIINCVKYNLNIPDENTYHFAILPEQYFNTTS